MWPFRRKPAWEVLQAQNIYDGLVADNDSGEITALTLRIPTTLHQAYQNKILLLREMLAFVALVENAGNTNLQRALPAFGNLLVSKAAERGLQISRDQLGDCALNDVERLMTEPLSWAQQWLAEFFAEPKHKFTVLQFADHCLRLHHAYNAGLQNLWPNR